MRWLIRTLAKSNKSKRGFTLVELMVVVIIVAILAAAAVPIYRFAVSKAYMSEAKATLGAIRSAEMVYSTENGGAYLTVDGVANTLEDLGLDVLNNTWFDEDSFQVSVIPAVAGTPASFTAMANGDKGDAKVLGIYVTMTNKGVWDYPTTAPF